VLEQFTFGNQLGSSAGVSRQFRLPYPQQYMVKLVKQSIPFWDELQSLTPVPLMDKVGTLWFGDPSVHSTEGNIGEAEKALKAEGVPYTTLDAKALESEYHFRNLPSTYTGLFQKDGASINLKATIRTLLDWNRSSPLVTMHDEAPATAIEWRDGAFHVRTPLGTFAGKKLILAPGPYGSTGCCRTPSPPSWWRSPWVPRCSRCWAEPAPRSRWARAAAARCSHCWPFPCSCRC
jgi:glycine/D-amino acid oxidase-like deaminating enzyme